ncbi:hypothetical protein ACQCVH_06665 [Bacillus infantis]|uniref:hypothetical protein n=1 Tax=Bacillus infantis TaxID=324767 RepID=UPI003CF90910
MHSGCLHVRRSWTVLVLGVQADHDESFPTQVIQEVLHQLVSVLWRPDVTFLV